MNGKLKISYRDYAGGIRTHLGAIFPKSDLFLFFVTILEIPTTFFSIISPFKLFTKYLYRKNYDIYDIIHRLMPNAK